MSGDPTRARSTASAWPWVLVPVVLFLALHLRALDYEFVWTDQAEIERGLLIRPPGRILAAFGEPMYRTLDEVAPSATQPYYRPLQVVALSAVDAAFGREPRAFRAVLFAVGAATIAAFFAVALPLVGDPRVAALVASIAAAHPAGIEDRVWIAGLAGALSALFTCASLACIPPLSRARSASGRAAWGALSTLALLGGLLSKESALVIPALVLALVVTIAVRERGATAPLRALAAERPALALVLVQIAVVAAYVFGLRPAILGESLSGATPIRGDWTLHVATVLATWPNRIAWLFAPLSSTTSDVVRLAGPGSPAAWLGAALGLAAPLVWLWMLRRRRVVAAFGWAWIWIAFLPTSGLAPLTHVVAVRYLSLSAFGAALVWPFVLDALRPARTARWLPAALGIALVLALAQRTWARVPDWRSDEALFEYAVARDPLYREGHYVLAVRLAERREFEAARARLDQLRIANGRFGARYSFLRDQDVALLLCRIDLEIGDPEDSLHVLKRELRPDSALLETSPALLRCGAESLARVGRADEARAIFDALDARAAR